MWQESADLVALNEEILNGKLHFLCSESESIDSTSPTTRLLVWGNLVRKKFLLLSKFFSNISTPKEPFIWLISWNILILNQLDFCNNDISNFLIIKQVKKKWEIKVKKIECGLRNQLRSWKSDEAYLYLSNIYYGSFCKNS